MRSMDKISWYHSKLVKIYRLENTMVCRLMSIEWTLGPYVRHGYVIFQIYRDFCDGIEHYNLQRVVME